MFSKYIINENKTLIEALKAINIMGQNEALTLFIEDKKNAIIGTLTDGDIRRSLINGYTLETMVGKIAHRNFSYLKAVGYDVKQIHIAKEKGIELLPVLNDQMQIVNVVNLKKQKSYLPIDAVLMAGGKGERLRPLTENKPKPLLEIGNKPIIDYNIDSLILYGINHISVTVNYLKEQIEDHFIDYKEGININCVREPSFLGTIGSIQFIEDFHNDTILLMNSDLFTNINYEDFYLHFKENNADMSVAAVPYSVNIPYGIFELNGREIQGVKEKPTYNYYANAGIYLIKKSCLDLIPKGIFFNATDFIELLINNKKKVIRYPLTGYWIDIGKHEDYKKANDFIKHL